MQLFRTFNVLNVAKRQFISCNVIKQHVNKVPSLSNSAFLPNINYANVKVLGDTIQLYYSCF